MQQHNARPVAKVELSFECVKLPNLDGFSKSDPQIWVELFDQKTNKYKAIGKTEVVRDNDNPKFVQSVTLDYFFEEKQVIRCRITDEDKPGKGFEHQDHIGDVTFSLCEVIGSKGQTLISAIPNKHRSKSHLITHCHELKGGLNEMIHFNISGDNLDKKDLFGKSDPYCEVFRSQDDGTWVLIHRTEYLKKTLSPRWQPFTFPAAKVDNGDHSRQLRFKVWDWDSDDLTKSDFIGEVDASIDELTNRSDGWELISLKKKKKKGSKYRNSGVLTIRTKKTKLASFMDYLLGGTEINLMVAIDFTASNGDPRTPNSLHFINPGAHNQYSEVIKAVGDILLPYDSDGLVPTYGFGAKVGGSNAANHCFHLNMQANPDIYGVDGIIQAYVNSFNHLTLYGPTNFAEIINAANERSSEMHATAQDVQAYQILLILTDGVITDYADTVTGIVASSNLPMSIVIVGIGNADFKQMEKLDGDDGALRAPSGAIAKADIVQFVPYRDFRGDPSRLAAAVLEEVPDQFVSYMRRNDILPHDPPSQAVMQQHMQAQLSRADTMQFDNQHAPPPGTYQQQPQGQQYQQPPQGQQYQQPPQGQQYQQYQQGAPPQQYQQGGPPPQQYQQPPPNY